MSDLDYGSRTYDDLEDINLNYVERIQDKSIEPMTTVVGITSNAGVVLTSDSQWTSNVKAFSSKLFKINEAIGLGASGTRPYIKFLVERLGREIRTDDLTAEFKLKQRIDKHYANYIESYREIDKTRLSTSRRSLRCNGIVGSKTI